MSCWFFFSCKKSDILHTWGTHWCPVMKWTLLTYFDTTGGSYLGYISLVLLVVLNKTASFENVHGGIFYNYKLVEGNVLLSLDNRGPRLCLRDCLMRTGCNAIYFDSVHLTCHLLKEAIYHIHWHVSYLIYKLIKLDTNLSQIMWLNAQYMFVNIY
jgi:hypothetical protein